MKTQDKKIIMMLQAFTEGAVLKAFSLYKDGLENKNLQTKKELKDEGWTIYNKKPTGVEFYYFEGKYWVQDLKIKAQQLKDLQEKQKEKEKSKKYTGQKMNLKQVDIKCPKCNSKMYKQGVCNGCKEGKQGFKIRLICEENPDHEILL